MEGFLLNESIQTNYYRNELIKRTRKPAFVKSDVPDFHDVIKDIIKGRFNSGYSKCKINKEQEVSLLSTICNRINDYTKNNYDFLFLIVDINMTTTVPLLFLVDPKTEAPFMSLGVIDYKGSTIISIISINNSVKNLDNLVKDVMDGVGKLF